MRVLVDKQESMQYSRSRDRYLTSFFISLLVAGSAQNSTQAPKGSCLIVAFLFRSYFWWLMTCRIWSNGWIFYYCFLHRMDSRHHEPPSRRRIRCRHRECTQCMFFLCWSPSSFCFLSYSSCCLCCYCLRGAHPCLFIFSTKRGIVTSPRYPT